MKGSCHPSGRRDIGHRYVLTNTGPYFRWVLVNIERWIPEILSETRACG
jgi:hypothetical protein